ncbi:acyl carrier protein [Streptomyces anulatus]|uniref:acyl carrier protein n=1 Tax=Streptomyces anulatus TaxID=1892 RepID=UPI0036D0A3FD
MTAPPDVSTTGIHRSVAEIVRVVTERETIDPAADLFDQGVTSLAFIRIVAQLNAMHDITLDVSVLEDASVDELSALVGRSVGRHH